MNNFFRLSIYLTIVSPDGGDVCMTLHRTLPFQPHEGLTLLIPALEDESDELELTLGAPTYSYNESGFVEHMTDESALEAVREGEAVSVAVKGMIDYYKSYGFERVRQ